MRAASAFGLAQLLLVASAYTPATTEGTDLLAVLGLKNLAEYELTSTSSSNCTLETVYYRQEWDNFTSGEKTAYVDAVLCLMEQPSQSGDFAPGAQNRYDDFVAVHINQTLTIHGTANFLSWHRYFTYAYEQALRTECGYTGYQPYLNWAKYSLNITGAPVFDGSSTSMTGNGAYYAYSGVDVGTVHIPAAAGGGCVTDGPFKNMSVNLGPISPSLPDISANPLASGLGYNPRCLRRDLSNFCGTTNLQDANITDLIDNYTDILSFQNRMEGDFNNGVLGVHTAGHFVVGGDPGGDLFASPGDPYFFLHHAQIDRTWWIWQNQDLEERLYAIAGTITIENEPPSRNGTLEDILDLGTLADPITIADAMSTLDGPFCYVYL